MELDKTVLGNKRKDLDDDSRKLILKAYDDFLNKEYKDKDKIVESKILYGNCKTCCW